MDEDDESVAEANEIEDVDKTPGKPSDKAAELDFAKHADRFRFADGGHGPFVEVDEGGTLFFREPFAEDLGDIAPLLDGDGGKAGEGFPFFVHGAGGIANDEDFRMIGNRKIGVDDDAPLPIERDIERF